MVRFRRLRGWLGSWWAYLTAAVLVQGTTVLPPEFPELVNGSDYIVHAVVKSVSTEKRNREKGARIVTLVELEVIEVVAGTPPERVTLELLGGKVGDEELRVVGMPQFRVGDEDILFVSGNGRTVCPLYAMMHGRYRVNQDATNGRRYVTRADGRALTETSEVALPMISGGAGEIVRRAAPFSAAMEPEDFIRQVREAVKPGSALSRGK
jgi:hypothetical protein